MATELQAAYARLAAARKDVAKTRTEFRKAFAVGVVDTKEGRESVIGDRWHYASVNFKEGYMAGVRALGYCLAKSSFAGGDSVKACWRAWKYGEVR